MAWSACFGCQWPCEPPESPDVGALWAAFMYVDVDQLLSMFKQTSIKLVKRQATKWARACGSNSLIHEDGRVGWLAFSLGMDNAERSAASRAATVCVFVPPARPFVALYIFFIELQHSDTAPVVQMYVTHTFIQQSHGSCYQRKIIRELSALSCANFDTTRAVLLINTVCYVWVTAICFVC